MQLTELLSVSSLPVFPVPLCFNFCYKREKKALSIPNKTKMMCWKKAHLNCWFKKLKWWKCALWLTWHVHIITGSRSLSKFFFKFFPECISSLFVCVHHSPSHYWRLSFYLSKYDTYLHTVSQQWALLLQYQWTSNASGPLALLTHGRCQRHRNTAGWGTNMRGVLIERNRWMHIVVLRRRENWKERTALMPQNWTPAQGMARVSSCHLTQREVRTSFTVIAFFPCALSLSFCMSSSSSFKHFSCHSHCKAFTHKHTHKLQQRNVPDVELSLSLHKKCDVYGGPEGQKYTDISRNKRTFQKT